MRSSTLSSPARVGLIPVPGRVTQESGSMAAATIQNAADEKSPGIVHSPPLRGLDVAMVIADPSM